MFELQKELETKNMLLDYYSKQIEKVKEDIKDIHNKLEKCYSNYHKLNDLEKEVFIEHFKNKWTVNKIATFHGYSDRQIYRIIKELKEKMC